MGFNTSTCYATKTCLCFGNLLHGPLCNLNSGPSEGLCTALTSHRSDSLEDWRFERSLLLRGACAVPGGVSLKEEQEANIFRLRASASSSCCVAPERPDTKSSARRPESSTLWRTRIFARRGLWHRSVRQTRACSSPRSSSDRPASSSSSLPSSSPPPPPPHWMLAR